MCDARRVLAVEDHAGLRALLRAALAAAGYEVRTVAHGGEALNLLADFRPCAILLDLGRPAVDGWAFARAYRAAGGADARLIAVTAEPRHPRLPELGAAAVLPKPVDLDALVAAVDRHCRAHPPSER